jgi:hypothetical protein
MNFKFDCDKLLYILLAIAVVAFFLQPRHEGFDMPGTPGTPGTKGCANGCTANTCNISEHIDCSTCNVCAPYSIPSPSPSPNPSPSPSPSPNPYYKKEATAKQAVARMGGESLEDKLLREANERREAARIEKLRQKNEAIKIVKQKLDSVNAANFCDGGNHIDCIGKAAAETFKWQTATDAIKDAAKHE